MHFNCFGLLDMCKGNDHLGQKEAEGILYKPFHDLGFFKFHLKFVSWFLASSMYMWLTKKIDLLTFFLIFVSLNDSEICTDNVRVFSYNSLRSATDNFHPTNRIGGGGFGVVFRVRNNNLYNL